MLVISLASLSAMLIQLILHWFPWRLLLGYDLPRIPSYTAGTLGILLPYTVVILILQSALTATLVLGSIWSIAIAAGIAVCLAHLTDSAILNHLKAVESSAREKQLENQILQSEQP